MSLAIKLAAECRQCNAADWRRYADLLRASDPKTMDELKALMVKLQKTSSDVTADKRTIDQVVQLQSQIGAGRNTESQQASLWQSIQQHDQDTKTLLEQRRALIQPAHDERARLIGLNSAAVSAIDQLSALKKINPEMLNDIEIPDPQKLG